MSRYTRGRAAEHRVRALLEEAGYTVVRGAGSKGPVDLVAWDGVSLRLVQVKAGTRGASPAEREAPALLPRPANATVEIWRLVPRQAPVIVRVPAG